MFYTTIDKKLLASIISAQSDLQCWVIIDSNSQCIYHSNGWERGYVDDSFASGNKHFVRLRPYEINLSLDNLMSLGFVEKAPGGPAIHATYRGWYDKSMRIHESLFAFFNNLMLPVIVAILSSVITTVILQLVI